jgi:hypothetical protein
VRIGRYWKICVAVSEITYAQKNPRRQAYF